MSNVQYTGPALVYGRGVLSIAMRHALVSASPSSTIQAKLPFTVCCPVMPAGIL